MINPKIPLNPYSTYPMIIGEGEGREEIARGEFFVGRSGIVLNTMLKNAGLDREKIYINNVVRFNSIDEIRTPTPTDIKEALPRLLKEIGEYKPKVILTLGNIPLRALLKKNGINKNRGLIHSVKFKDNEGKEFECIIIPAFHPAYVLRNPNKTNLLQADILKFANIVLNGLKDQAELEEENKREYIEVTNEAQIDEFEKDIINYSTNPEFKKKLYALDIETTGLNIFSVDTSIVSIAIYIDSLKKGWAFPLTFTNGKLSFVWSDSAQGKLLLILQSILEDSNNFVILHNAMFDLVAIEQILNIKTKATIIDSMVLQYLLDENMDLGLKKLVSHYFNIPNYSIMEEKGIDFDTQSLSGILYYNYLDTKYTFKLAKDIMGRLIKKHHDSYKFYIDITEPLMKLLIEMRVNGAKLDTNYLSNLDVELYTKMVELRQEIEQEVKQETGWKEFNIQSTKQLIEYFYDFKGLEPPVYTKKGSPSVNAESLKLMIKKYKDIKIIEKLQEYNKIKQQYNLYVKQMQKFLDVNDKIHSNFNITGTVTGRLSSSQPNLFNIARNVEVKRLFIPSIEDWMIGENDLSQIELRVMAFMSKDPNMMNAYLSGTDLHKLTASKVFGVSLEEVTKEQRQKAKAVNFGIIYLISANGLADQIESSTKEAQQFIDEYFRQFPAVSNFIQNIIYDAHTYGYVKTPFGKYRHLPEIHSPDTATVRRAERQAVNFVIQSTAATLNFLGMLKLRELVKDENLDNYVRFINTVYDSVIIEFSPNVLDQLGDLIKKAYWDYLTEIMKNKLGNGIIKSEFKYGQNWGDTTEYPFE